MNLADSIIYVALGICLVDGIVDFVDRYFRFCGFGGFQYIRLWISVAGAPAIRFGGIWYIRLVVSM